MPRYIPDQVQSGQVPSVINAGSENEQMLVTTYVLGPQSNGSQNEKMAESGTVTVSSGSENQGLANGNVMGSGARSTGTQDQALAASDVGSASQSAGSEGQSLSAASTVLGRGFVTTATTAGGKPFTNPTNVEADDGAKASWTVTDGVGTGASVTTSGTITATNPALGSTPTGWSRTKVEVLVHYSDSATGMNSTGDSATFNVQLQDKNGASLQNNIVNDVYTANNSHADSTVAVDVTTSVAAVTDADLALVKLLCTSTFVRTLVAVSSRTWDVQIDSLSLRVTYTRSGIT